MKICETHCPKCGCVNVSRRYQPEADEIGHICLICRYRWQTITQEKYMERSIRDEIYKQQPPNDNP